MHISQLADYRVPSVEDVVRVGDEVMVMVIGIDDSGKIKLSRQAVLEGWTAEEAREHDRVPSRGGGSRGGVVDRGGRGGDRVEVIVAATGGGDRGPAALVSEEESINVWFVG